MAVTGERDGRKKSRRVGFPVPAAIHPRNPLLQGRLERLGHPSADFDDVGGYPKRLWLGERGPRYANFPCASSTRSHRDRRAVSTGAAQGCVDEIVKYAREREGIRAGDRRYQSIPRFSPSRAHGSPRAHTARTAYLRRRGAEAGR